MTDIHAKFQNIYNRKTLKYVKIIITIVLDGVPCN